MAISDSYLASMRLAVRRSAGNSDVDAELTDLINEARLDMVRAGVLETKASDETDALIKGAVRCFVRWKFGLSNPDAEAMKTDYTEALDNIRKSAGYGYTGASR